MVHVRLTQNLARHVGAVDAEVGEAATVRASLDAYFGAHPNVRHYVLDDQGAVRNHVVVFVDGVPIEDRAEQSDAVSPTAKIVVMQALSGG